MTGRRFPNPLLPILAAVLVALPLLAPVAMARDQPGVAVLLRAAFAAVCHQLPDRSFLLLGEPVAVCHRCLGLYVGGLAGLLLLPWLPRLHGWLLARPRRLAWFAVPLVVDVLLPFDTWWSRFGSGLLAAFPIAAIVWVAWEEVFVRRPGRSFRSARDRPAPAGEAGAG
jgi:uncharacterized membrane protein